MSVIVGIPACNKLLEGLAQHAAAAVYGDALLRAAGAIPILLPPVGAALLPLLDRIDGLLLSGSVSNVQPPLYGVAESLTPDQHDPARDATTLPLIRAAVARGMPVLAICRGIQELNVALGGTLHQQVHALPGRLDHREPGGTPEQQFTIRQRVTLSGSLALLVGATDIMVNSLHGQAVDRPAEALAVEALAEDGTIEAVRGAACAGFVLGVQWHPEWHATTDGPSRAIFAAFGDACRAYAAGLVDSPLVQRKIEAGAVPPSG